MFSFKLYSMCQEIVMEFGKIHSLTNNDKYYFQPIPTKNTIIYNLKKTCDVVIGNQDLYQSRIFFLRGAMYHSSLMLRALKFYQKACNISLIS